MEAYLNQLEDVPPHQIAYVDETGVDTCLYREYAWSKRGEVVYGKVSGRKYKRAGIVAARMGNRIIAPLQYDGTMDSTLFELWFRQCLLPTLPESAIIVMDNAAFHRKSRLFEFAQIAGHRLVFLPPYSPELNPIENFWSWLKRQLRKILPQHNSFNDALFECFQVR